MTENSKPLPDLDDKATSTFWRNTRAGRLTAPRCTHCSYLLWPPEVLCPECQHTEFAWENVPTLGTLWSYAVYHRALDPAFADDLPYVVGLVELAPGLKMYGLVRASPAQVHIGMALAAVFDEVTSDVTMVRWEPA